MPESLTGTMKKKSTALKTGCAAQKSSALFILYLALHTRGLSCGRRCYRRC